MAKINASQISYNSDNSWYKRLYNVASKLGATKYSTSISAGTKITASDMNTFINRLSALKTNTYGSYASWSSYQPSTVTASKQINESSTYTKINNMLTSLESIHSNDITTADVTCGDDKTTSNQTTNYVTSGYDNEIVDYTCSYDQTCSTNGNDADLGDFGENGGDATNSDEGRCITCEVAGEDVSDSNPNEGDYYYTEGDQSDRGDCSNDTWNSDDGDCTTAGYTAEGHCITEGCSNDITNSDESDLWYCTDDIIQNQCKTTGNQTYNSDWTTESCQTYGVTT